jgi:hypothetical protein
MKQTRFLLPLLIALFSFGLPSMAIAGGSSNLFLVEGPPLEIASIFKDSLRAVPGALHVSPKQPNAASSTSVNKPTVIVKADPNPHWFAVAAKSYQVMHNEIDGAGGSLFVFDVAFRIERAGVKHRLLI